MKINYDIKLIAGILLFVSLLSYGLHPMIPFVNSICVFLSAILVGVLYFFEIKPRIIDKTKEAQSKKDQEMEDIASMLAEMDEVIKEYENMLSEQVIKLPCACGKTLFEGILIPNVENMCECPSCKETYKVLISYDSILMTEPLESSVIYDNLSKIEKNSNNNTLE